MTTPRCSRCHRPLTDPASIARGMGPTCAQRAAQDPGGGLPGGRGRDAVQSECPACPECGARDARERARAGARVWWGCGGCGRVWVVGVKE